MAIGATIYRFSIAFCDVDNGVDVDLELHIARHPSESLRFFIVRVLARCFEHADGVELTKGVSDTELPAIIVRDVHGGLTAWIEVGVPAAKKVHKATSRAERVVVYAHKQAPQLLQRLRQAELRRADRVTVVHFDDELLDTLCEALIRTPNWSVTCSDGTLYIEADGTSAVGAVHRVALA